MSVRGIDVSWVNHIWKMQTKNCVYAYSTIGWVQTHVASDWRFCRVFSSNSSSSSSSTSCVQRPAEPCGNMSLTFWEVVYLDRITLVDQNFQIHCSHGPKINWTIMTCVYMRQVFNQNKLFGDAESCLCIVVGMFSAHSWCVPPFYLTSSSCAAVSVNKLFLFLFVCVNAYFLLPSAYSDHLGDDPNRCEYWWFLCEWTGSDQNFSVDMFTWSIFKSDFLCSCKLFVSLKKS